MSGGGGPASYWCEVLAQRPVYGTGQDERYVLGVFRTISPVLALRWLRGQARRIADRLDPEPGVSPWSRACVCETQPVRDAPTELRVWAADPDAERAGREHVKAGHPLFVTAQDADCACALSVRPVRLPTGRGRDASPGPLLHRVGGLVHPLSVLALDPWR